MSGSIEIRRARESDAPALADLFMRVWRESLGYLLPTGFLEHFDEAERRESFASRSVDPCWVLLVSETETGAITGMFGAADNDHPPLEYSKQIRALYVDPACQRRGTGSLLLSEGLRILAASGAPNVMLWCIADNLAACSFYRRHGGRRIEGVMPPPDYRDMAHVIYAWPDLEAYTKSL